ncbi:MAG: NAD(P)/FAD-dependent oxidoreductase [Nannocystaceae bacterium]
MSLPARFEYDAVVIGSGPNGLSAAIRLAEKGRSVLVVEGSDRVGGGMRCAELTLPGFRHDFCSAVHPMGVLSPYWRTLPLAHHGLEWRHADLSAAHPLPDGSAALLARSVDDTADSLGPDGDAYRRLMMPLLRHPQDLVDDLLLMRAWPRRPFAMARFGFSGLRSARGLARSRFGDDRARALLAGCAAHSILPLDFKLTAAVGMIFCLTAHIQNWPVVAGGTEMLAKALAGHLLALGGDIHCNRRIHDMADLPPARAYLFDTAPREVLKIAEHALPDNYRRRLRAYRYGPGVYKVDFALREPIPWRATGCQGASTVHVGGTLEELCASEAAMWSGEVSKRPFVMVCQQSHFDPARAPMGQHTGYAYIHVPNGCELNCEQRIVDQIERFAPGFRDCILATHVTQPMDLQRYNPAFVGGSVTGGVADLGQLFTRPVARLNPHTTPNPRIFLCSAATPPGGGVHGLCGFRAAETVLRRILR